MQKRRRSPRRSPPFHVRTGAMGCHGHSFKLLAEAGPFDAALIQTVMTYWYPGVQEVIEDIRTYSPQTPIVLGGVYATLCPQHARRLGADLVIDRDYLEPLWELLRLTPSCRRFPSGRPMPTCVLVY